MKQSKLKARVSWVILLLACLMIFIKWTIPSVLRSAHILFTKVPQSKTWVSTEGNVEWTTASQSRASGSNSTGADITHKCTYEFNVDGKTYVGRDMRIGEDAVVGKGVTGFTRKDLKDRYEKADGVVTVYYNPDNPAECALAQEASNERVFWFIVSPLIILGVTLLFVWTARRHFREDGADRPTSVDTDCPHCGEEMSVDSELLGQEIPCAHCGEQVALPEA